MENRVEELTREFIRKIPLEEKIVREIVQNVLDKNYSFYVWGGGRGYIRIGRYEFIVYCAWCTEDVPERVEEIKKEGLKPIALNIDNQQDCEIFNSIMRILREFGGEDVFEFICD